MDYCGILNKGQDNACPTLQKGYVQEVKLANFADIDTYTITKDCDVSSKHRVALTLKTGATTYSFTGNQRGTSIRSWYSKTSDDNGYPMYTHHVQIVITRVTEEQKCILKALDNGLFVAFTKLRNYDNANANDIQEAIEVYGFGNGLSTGDYDYNIAETGGVTLIDLTSQEGMEESDIPFMYASATPGSEIEDWESDFATP